MQLSIYEGFNQIAEHEASALSRFTIHSAFDNRKMPGKTNFSRVLLISSHNMHFTVTTVSFLK